MKKVTYLVGAGASANSLPVQANISQQISKLQANIISNSLFSSTSDNAPLAANLPHTNLLINELIEDLQWLSEQSSINGSVDTYARQLYFMKEKHLLKRLKNVYSTFFVITQSLEIPDRRYRPLINSIITEELQIKDNVKILSWNYDFQIEKILAEYLKTTTLKQTQTKLRIHSGFQYSLSENISMFKLNGTVGYENMNPFDTELNPSNNNRQVHMNILRNYGVVKYSHENYDSTLSFAWETKDHLHLILNEIKETEILICIGYSFPDYNREIDIRLISQMSSNLEEIYIQDPNANDLKQQLQNHLRIFGSFAENINIIPLSNTDKFYIPTMLLTKQ